MGCRAGTLRRFWRFLPVALFPLVNEPAAAPAVDSPLHDLDLSAEFRQRIADRQLMDEYQAAAYATEVPLTAEPMRPAARRLRERPGTIRLVHAED